MYQPRTTTKDFLRRISFSELIVRNLLALAFGVMIAAFIAGGVGISFPTVKLRVFVLLVLFWTAVSISILARTIRERKQIPEMFESIQNFRKETLPLEFRFITLDTSLQEIVEKIGPYTSIRRSGLFEVAQYDLPFQTAVLLFFESPSKPTSRIRGIRVLSQAS